MKSKIGNIYGRVVGWFTEKKLATAFTVVFVVSLLPLLYMCRYVHATGDDYGYGAATHAAWSATHSLIEAFKASVGTIEKFYIGWQGTWSSILFFTLQPEVFMPGAYWIVPILMIGLTILGTSLVVYYLLVKKAGFPVTTFLIVDCSILFAILQFIPSTKSAIFWYNGTAHYIIPYFLAMVSIYCFLKFTDTYRRRYWLGAFLCMMLLGGASYLAALLAPIVLFYILLFQVKKRPKSLWLLIPLAVEGVGLTVSMLAPGNQVRGGEELAFSVGKAAGTIVEAFKQGVFTAGSYIKEKPLVFVMLILMTVFVAEEALRRERKFFFRYPLLFIVLMFCLYCAMFTPALYAGTDVSGGVPNTIFQVFILTASASLIYTAGWAAGKLRTRSSGGKLYLRFRCWVTAPVILICLVVLIICRSGIREMTAVQCISYVRSGQAEDYRIQMEERLELLLDDTLKEVYLPEINQDQGPLMHMEVMPDPEEWTNRVTAEFYGKDKIYRIQRN